MLHSRRTPRSAQLLAQATRREANCDDPLPPAHLVMAAEYSIATEGLVGQIDLHPLSPQFRGRQCAPLGEVMSIWKPC